MQLHPAGSRRRGQPQPGRVLRRGLSPLPVLPPSLLLSPLPVLKWSLASTPSTPLPCAPSPRSRSFCPRSGGRGEGHGLFLRRETVQDASVGVEANHPRHSEQSETMCPPPPASHSRQGLRAPSLAMTQVSLVVLHTQELHTQGLDCLLPRTPPRPSTPAQCHLHSLSPTLRGGQIP